MTAPADAGTRQAQEYLAAVEHDLADWRSTTGARCWRTSRSTWNPSPPRTTTVR